VIDDTGAVTWTNQPRSFLEMYEAQAAPGEPRVVVPAEALPAAGLYAVAVAGVTRTARADISNMNADLSSLRSGLVQFHRVDVVDPGPAD
jgi:hypothetical protein